jgi:hypothetical protein
MHNNKVKIYRYAMNIGEAVLIFDLSFKRFNLVLDFKYLNCYRVKIDKYTNSTTRNGQISNRSAFVAPGTFTLTSSMLFQL